MIGGQGISRHGSLTYASNVSDLVRVPIFSVLSDNIGSSIYAGLIACYTFFSVPVKLVNIKQGRTTVACSGHLAMHSASNCVVVYFAGWTSTNKDDVHH